MASKPTFKMEKVVEQIKHIFKMKVSQPQRMTLLYWCCGNSNLRPGWGQLATPYLYGQFGPLWCPMAFFTYHSSLANHGLRPYPAIIGLPGQFPYPQPLLSGLGGLSVS
ncbi:hypothetical protein O181_109670 [Austropuccinia psidii MF-1]|uniref:Uncharacterized protein n=1 Tax=Austropuccinia psidii MF-1 TaxID=1389203 RepID=A0A9Q3JUV0_9BASI|nr:hypothetical protein [Austropuccinia psidii MF-1]